MCTVRVPVDAKPQGKGWVYHSRNQKNIKKREAKAIQKEGYRVM